MDILAKVFTDLDGAVKERIAERKALDHEITGANARAIRCPGWLDNLGCDTPSKCECAKGAKDVEAIVMGHTYRRFVEGRT